MSIGQRNFLGSCGKHVYACERTLDNSNNEDDLIFSVLITRFKTICFHIFQKRKEIAEIHSKTVVRMID